MIQKKNAASEFMSEKNILADRHLICKIELLRNRHDPKTQRGFDRDMLQCPALKNDLATVGARHAVDAFDQRGLACSVLPDEPGNGAFPYGQRNVVQNLDFRIRFVKPSDFKERFRIHTPFNL